MGTRLRYIFVHGTAGWGSYDERYERLPYWGMRTGDLMAHLREKGYSCHAASVSAEGSAWDRACELYAQIRGTRVDYGLAHSERFGHERFGEDYSGRTLCDGWDDDVRLVLIGHSFGGTTVRLFAELLAHGDEDERARTEPSELSTLFAGGQGRRVAAVCAVACALNGNATFDMLADPTFDPESSGAPWWSKPFGRAMSRELRDRSVGTDPRDCADFDMRIDTAQLLNERMGTLDHVLYLSVPCSFTRRKGTRYVPERGMEPFFVERAYQLGRYVGVTGAGRVIARIWRESDGRVSTISEIAPLGAPVKDLDPDDLQLGVWNVYPVHHGDHMSLQGGLMHKHDVRAFYERMLEMVEGAV